MLGGLVPTTPFKVGTVSAVKLAREESRTRRLQPGEEERLLLQSNGLRDLIVAALETGCRLGSCCRCNGNRSGGLLVPAGWQDQGEETGAWASQWCFRPS